METDIKRKAEMCVADSLTAALPGIRFYPSRHAATDAATDLTPPYAIVECQDAGKVMATEDTWLVNMGVGYISHIEDPYNPDLVRDIRLALQAIAAGLNSTYQIVVHGLDVSNVDDFEDRDGHARGDVITFVLACSG